jgi:DNA helicase-2/ATP-dependent DNA helicase PcrA
MFVWTEGDLNKEQEDAICQEGNVFLIACPGSGKTRALTYKIAYEISRLKSTKQFVVAITYTNRASYEITERIQRLGLDTSQLWIGTIHSFCLEWILKPYSIYHERLNRGFRVINSHDTETMITELCEPYKSQKIKPWDCGFYFTKDGCILSCNDRSKHAIINVILQKYFKILEQKRQIDFELILSFAHELIKSKPSISVLLANLFPFILVDEYQDTKEIQYAIIASILRAGKGKSQTFIVGDPNQAIFQSLGGYPITVAEFKTMAGIDMHERELSQNYRSPTRIVGYFGNFNVYKTKIVAASKDKDYRSLISFDKRVTKDRLTDEVVRLIRYNIETLGTPPHEVCVLAPQWMFLGSMTRNLVSKLPQYEFDGPQSAPFARDIENFWYKLSKIILTSASPDMYVRRLRWAGDVLKELTDAGVSLSAITKKSLLRTCNSITVNETDGLLYLAAFFDALFSHLGIDFRSVPVLAEHHNAFFESSKARVAKVKKDGAECIGDITAFRKVFSQRSGITISTIHGIKGDEYDCVIAYALLQDMVPHFSDPDSDNSAKKLLYVICSRAKKNLHLISERGRFNGIREEYQPTRMLDACTFAYESVP